MLDYFTSSLWGLIYLLIPGLSFVGLSLSENHPLLCANMAFHIVFKQSDAQLSMPPSVFPASHHTCSDVSYASRSASAYVSGSMPSHREVMQDVEGFKHVEGQENQILSRLHAMTVALGHESKLFRRSPMSK